MSNISYENKLNLIQELRSQVLNDDSPIIGRGSSHAKYVSEKNSLEILSKTQQNSTSPVEQQIERLREEEKKKKEEEEMWQKLLEARKQ